MKSCSAALAAYLNTGQQFLLADLYTIEMAIGTTVRYATGEPLAGFTAVVANSNSFDASSLVITRGKIKTAIGFAVDTLELKVTAEPTHLLNGLPFLQALRLGALDGAHVVVDRLVMQHPGDTSLGTYNVFSGLVADITIGRFSADIHVNSDLDLLSQNLPRNLFQPGCLNTLFDANCTLVKASFAVASAVASGSTKNVINCALSQVAGYFTQGTITFTSGVLSGLSATVSTYVPGVLTLIGPQIALPGIGDAFNAYPGCAKTMAACSNNNPAVGPQLNNLPHFRGTPFVPTPETLTGF
ncbi:MAG: baseplate hub protein [Terriglobales bacterium]